MTINRGPAQEAIALAVLLALTCASAGPMRAEEPPTFYREVLPILQEECQACHREGGADFGGMIAPMAFLDYPQVRPWAKAIARRVGDRSMPPWHASPKHAGVFANERTLSEDQIQTLVSWVQSGAVAGNPEDAPPAKEWAAHDGWQMGEPDLVITMPEPYLVADEVEDLYIDFPMEITKEMLSEPRWVKSVEVRPGSSAVHHVVGYPVGGMVPGGDPTIYADGMGVLLEPGTSGIWAMHYHKEPGPGTAVWDQTRAAIQFYPVGTKMKHLLRTACLCNFDFTIPAGDPNYEVLSEFTFDHDSLIIDIMPHMHLRGKAAKFEAFYPDGTSKVILDVPKYDFSWQTTYQFKEFEFVPAGTKIVSTTAFDNSAANPHNPDPTIDVSYGKPTTSEMIKSPLRYIHAVDEEDVEAEVARMRTKKKAGTKKKASGKKNPANEEL